MDISKQFNIFYNGKLLEPSFNPELASARVLARIFNNPNYSVGTRRIASYHLRNRLGNDDPMQNYLAPIDHANKAEFDVNDNLALAIVHSGFVPAYTITKALGIKKARSDPSLEELKGGFRGIGRGLYNRLIDPIIQALAIPNKNSVLPTDQQLLEMIYKAQREGYTGSFENIRKSIQSE